MFIDADPTNDDRAAWAGLAMRAYSDAIRHNITVDFDPEALARTGAAELTEEAEILGDLLADLHHWADRAGLDFTAISGRVEARYRNEVAEEADQDQRQTRTTTDRYQDGAVTGYDALFSVQTSWASERDAWATTVLEMTAERWRPLEFLLSDTEPQARATHRQAVSRHPKTGPAKTTPRVAKGPRNLCTRCGNHFSEPHQPGCRPD